MTTLALAHDVDERGAQDIALAVTEACTNVVVHAYEGREPGEIKVEVDRLEDSVRVLVTDSGYGLRPRPDSPGSGSRVMDAWSPAAGLRWSPAYWGAVRPP